MSSKIDIDACDFCTSMIKLNINLLANSDKKDYIRRKRILINGIKRKHSELASMSDYDIQNYLYGIYTSKIDNDKYGKNNLVVERL